VTKASERPTGLAVAVSFKCADNSGSRLMMDDEGLKGWRARRPWDLDVRAEGGDGDEG